MINATSNGAAKIGRERRRQIIEEFYSADFDDGHTHGELVRAGVCYAYAGLMLAAGDSLREVRTSGKIAGLWPWGRGNFKPSEDAARNLEKAGALMAAEIDRLERLERRARAAESVSDEIGKT